MPGIKTTTSKETYLAEEGIHVVTARGTAVVVVVDRGHFDPGGGSRLLTVLLLLLVLVLLGELILLGTVLLLLTILVAVLLLLVSILLLVAILLLIAILVATILLLLAVTIEGEAS